MGSRMEWGFYSKGKKQERRDSMASIAGSTDQRCSEFAFLRAFLSGLFVFALTDDILNIEVLDVYTFLLMILAS